MMLLIAVEKQRFRYTQKCSREGVPGRTNGVGKSSKMFSGMTWQKVHYD